MLKLQSLSMFILYILASTAIIKAYTIPTSISQEPLRGPPKHRGHNELWVPNPTHPIPYKLPLPIDERVNWFEQAHNGSRDGYYKRSSCPAINMLANRGYIHRSGRNITYESLAQAVRDVYNFGDDNIMVVLDPTFEAHGWPSYIDLDFFNDDAVQNNINCPAAPTRNDRDIGENVNINTTLLESLLNSSKDGATLSLEDLAEHHHLRHNQSVLENPNFRFGSHHAICSLAQYTNLVGVLGRQGKYGLSTLYVEDLRHFYLNEDLPLAYMRRELPYYSTEANNLIDRMAHHIGFLIERPYPPNDQDPGIDIEPMVANYEKPCQAIY
ncbi:hypothetical protein MMC34_000256 [Xylographa carneopallida]|nr:hypothetical protein [Xylographa carneopallida]